MKLEIDMPEHHYNNIIAFDSVSLGRVPYKGIIMYAINAIKRGKVLEQEPTTKNDLAVDCVARQDVKEYIEGFINEYTPKEELEFINLELDGLKHISSVTPQEPRWIPTAERLPQESFNSIIGWDDYRKRCVLVQYIDGHFHITGKAESFDIKAWMPLPKGYREVEE